MLQINFYLSWKQGFPFSEKIYSTNDLCPFADVYRFFCNYHYNKYVFKSHVCHSKLHFDLWQQASHILGKET